MSAYSYDGKLFVGVTSCTDLMPDPDLFARDMLEELSLLGAALAAPQRPRVARKPAARRKNAAATRRPRAKASRKRG